MHPAEHIWHACDIPEPPRKPGFSWICPICSQIWVWRRPPRPVAKWVRRSK